MNLAVKFYKDHPNKPVGMPDNWPYTCREIGEATAYKDEPGPWLIVSKEEYDEFINDNIGIKEKWNEIYLNEVTKTVHPILTTKGAYIRVCDFLGVSLVPEIIPPKGIDDPKLAPIADPNDAKSAAIVTPALADAPIETIDPKGITDGKPS